MVCLTTCFVLRSYFVWLKGSMKNHFKFLQGLKKSFTLSPLTSFLLSDHALLNRVLNLIFSLRLFLSFSSFFFQAQKGDLELLVFLPIILENLRNSSLVCLSYLSFCHRWLGEFVPASLLSTIFEIFSLFLYFPYRCWRQFCYLFCLYITQLLFLLVSNNIFLIVLEALIVSLRPFKVSPIVFSTSFL